MVVMPFFSRSRVSFMKIVRVLACVCVCVYKNLGERERDLNLGEYFGILGSMLDKKYLN